MKKISLLIPVRNESDNIPHLRDLINNFKNELTALNYKLEILVNDNASEDNTRILLSDWADSNKDIFIHTFEKNIGFQASLIAGMRRASGDALIVFQGDMQDPYQLMFHMIQEWEAGNKIVATKIISRQEHFLDRFTRTIFYSALSKGSNNSNLRNFQDFYLLDSTVYKEIASLPLQDTFIRSEIASRYKIESVLSYKRLKRLRGKTNFNFFAKSSLAIDGLLINSRTFQSWLMIAGFLGALISFLIGLSLIYLHFMGVNFGAKGWLSLFVLIIFGLSFTVFLITVILEYLVRMYGKLINLQSEIYKLSNK